LVQYVEAQQWYVVDSIIISGNQKTVPEIILDELEFAKGDTITQELLEASIRHSENKLRLLGLFNFTDIAYSVNGSSVSVFISLVERWYLWIYPIFELADQNFDTYFFNRQWERLNYGVSFEKHNVLGRNLLLKAKIRFGYKEQYSIYFSNPGSFRRKSFGYWAGGDFFRKKEIVAGFRDYMPVYESSEPNYLYHQFGVQAGVSYRVFYNSVCKAKLAYHNFYRNTWCTPDRLNLSENEFSCTEFSIKFEHDTRNNKYFPTSGFFAGAEITQYGIPFTDTYKWINQTVFNAEANVFFQFSQRFFTGIETMALLHHSKNTSIPLGLYRSLGYETYLRGADNFVLNSEIYLLCKSSFRYAVFRELYKELNLLKLEQFDKIHYELFLTAFADLGYVKNYNIVAGLGAGFELVTYYDRVLSVYYAYNNLTEKFNIFVQFKTPILKQY